MYLAGRNVLETNSNTMQDNDRLFLDKYIKYIINLIIKYIISTILYNNN